MDYVYSYICSGIHLFALQQKSLDDSDVAFSCRDVNTPGSTLQFQQAQRC